MADLQKQLLDELMGADRDVALAEKARRKDTWQFTDPDVDRYFLGGCSPYGLFPASMSWIGLGPNPFGPSTEERRAELKAEWDALPQWRRDEFGFEYETMKLLESLVKRCDLRVARNRERQRADNEVPKEMTDRLAALQAQVRELTERIISSKARASEGPTDGGGTGGATIVSAVISTTEHSNLKTIDSGAKATVVNSKDCDQVVGATSGTGVATDESTGKGGESGGDAGCETGDGGNEGEGKGTIREGKETNMARDKPQEERPALPSKPTQAQQLPLSPEALRMLTAQLNSVVKAKEALEAQIKKRRVVEVCSISGNILSTTDGEDRWKAHYEGKLYKGWKLVREKLAELKAKNPQPPRPRRRQEESGARRGAHSSSRRDDATRDRKRSRSTGRRRSHTLDSDERDDRRWSSRRHQEYHGRDRKRRSRSHSRSRGRARRGRDRDTDKYHRSRSR